MSKITDIKQKISQMEAGEFQELCDAYLYRRGYRNIHSLGSQSGTRKTTKGIPDTYFIQVNGKYVLVMYTTQITGDTYKKIHDDIQDCFNCNKTGLNNADISEIIYCHTSSNLKAGQDKELRDFCKQQGVMLILYGVDTISHDIYNKYPAIARDMLSVSIDTEQFFSTQEFVENYNKNALAAPLDTVFQFRETEINKILEHLNASKVIIISGQPGVGKTRIGLEVIRRYTEVQNASVYCIRSNRLPVYEDLKAFLSEPGKYILLVDDANQITGLEHIVHYSQKSEYDVKIVITVREYAKSKVVKDICDIVRPEVIPINILSDEEIGKLVKDNLGILNQNYVDKIIRIAEGNARIAMLAGKIAQETDRLDSIDDASQLYEDYYGKYLSENNILQSDGKVLSSAGIIAFFDALHLDHLESLKLIFEQANLTETEFVSCLKRLHDIEVVDIYNDKAVKFSEQCLSNYLIKHVFVDQKIIPLDFMIKHCFTIHKQRVINAVNVLTSVFNSKEMRGFIERQVKGVWKALQDSNDQCFFDFVKTFYPLNPTETLIMLKAHIDAEKCVEFNIDTIKFEKTSNSVNNDVIEILSGYANTDDLDTALDLLFRYLRKRPDLFMDTYFAIHNGFGVSKDSAYFGYYTQIKLVEKIYEHSVNWTNHLIATLFIRIAKELLMLTHTPSESGRKGYSIVMYTIPITDSEGARKYRNLIWNNLICLSKNPQYHHAIGHILEEYGLGAHDKMDTGIIENDASYISKLVSEAYDPSNFHDCLIVQKLRRTFTRLKQDNVHFSCYKSNPSLILFNMLNGERYEYKYDYKRGEELKQAAIRQYTANCNISKIKDIIDVCTQLVSMKDHDLYALGDGLGKVFISIESISDLYIDAVNYYLSQNTPLGIYPNHIVSILFEILTEHDVYTLLDSYEYDTKNEWIYMYFYHLPETQLSEKHVHALYAFLQAGEGKLTRLRYRPLDFIDKYEKVDEDAFINCCRIIAKKMAYSPATVDIYFGSHLNPDESNLNDLIIKFRGHYDLLAEIYIKMLTASESTDCEGHLFSAIYDVFPSILDDYIQDMISRERRSDSSDGKRLACLWKKDDYICIMDKALQLILADEDKFYSFRQREHIGALLKCKNKDATIIERQDDWLRHYITKYCNNKKQMYVLFKAIGPLSAERRKQHIWHFTFVNKDFHAFEYISLDDGGWGSINEIEIKIRFLEELLPYYVGIDYLQHKQVILNDIDMWRKHIENEQIEAMLRG